MATRLEELEERLAALEAETGGYAPYGEEYAPYGEEYAPYGEEYAPYGEEYAPYGEEYAPYGEEEYTSYEEEMVVGAMEKEFAVEGVSELEIRSFSDTAEALETGQIQWDELSSVEQMGFWSKLKKIGRAAKRGWSRIKPYWRKAKPILARKWSWINYIPFEEEMAAIPKKTLVPPKFIPYPRCSCPRGYRTVRVTGYRCVRQWPWIRPRPALQPPIPMPPIFRK